MPEPLAAIVICTRNRAALLADCLSSLVAQAAHLVGVEIIVVDNASTDETADVAKRFSRDLPSLHCVREPKIGLSNARNRALGFVNAPWIAYLDDDAMVLEGYARRLKALTSDCDFDCFAGVYEPWYRDGRQSWYLDRYGSNSDVASEFGELPAGAFASGGVCLFRLDALRSVGGFDPGLGMTGGLVAYGEETRVQMLMRARGCRIGFDPNWRVKHLVPLRKQKMMWIFRSAFARGRDSWFAFDRRVTIPAMLNLSRKLVTRPFSGLGRTLTYWREWRSWRNPVVGFLEPFFLTLGQIAVGLRSWKGGK